MWRRVAFVLTTIVVLEVTTWLIVGRQRLIQAVPEMARKDFQFCEAHERRFRMPVNPPIRLVVCQPTLSELGSRGVQRLGDAVRAFNVTVIPEESAARMDPGLCYRPKCETPFLAVVETSLGPRLLSLGGNGFDHYYLHVGGAWLHVYSRMAWVS